MSITFPGYEDDKYIVDDGTFFTNLPQWSY